MKRPRRLKDPRLLRRDWIGDGIITLVAGGVLLVAVFLPWANEAIPGDVNYGLSMPDGINGVLQTQWGLPAAALALTVIALGVAVTLTTPRRLSWILGAAISGLGMAVFGVAQDSAAHVGLLQPGLGMYLTTLVGVLLVPIGIAAALVAWIFCRAAPTAPPARENAPPS